jgi:eukaryotic-like serine/threonine-protein kinase
MFGTTLGPYDVGRRLGQGGFGTVHEARHRERGERVALKLMRNQDDPNALLRFKNEFRSLRDVHHPNLVSLYDLFIETEEGSKPSFFTMELVDGVDILTFVRKPGAPRTVDEPTREIGGHGTPGPPGPPDPPDPPDPPGPAHRPRAPVSFDEAKLRAVFGQLVVGLSALHRMGKLHRDVKPSNVLVTGSGEVKVLDFGLVTDVDDGQSREGLGTPVYVAPERFSKKVPSGAAADWYGAGAILYEALTGRPPFAAGDMEQLLVEKLHEDPPRARSLVPGLPVDLEEAATNLLARDPTLRWTGADLLARFAPTTAAAPRPARSGRASTPFVGRTGELSMLMDALAQSRSAAVSVLLEGESGIGKTAIAQRFVDDVTETVSGALVLTGRCFDRESVPYKAFDGVVDALSRELLRLDDVDVAAIMPRTRDAAILAQVFPVLTRVDAFRVASAPLDVTIPSELRKRAFAALRELFARVADRRPLVLVVDDLHWADADSLALLDELLHPPRAPTLLFVATVRVPAIPAVPGDVRRMPIGGLTKPESAELVGLLSPGADAGAIEGEARGHPLFIHELAGRQASEGVTASLDESVWGRLLALEPSARRLVEVLCVAATPVSQTVAAAAAALRDGASSRRRSTWRAPRDCCAPADRCRRTSRPTTTACARASSRASRAAYGSSTTAASPTRSRRT